MVKGIELVGFQFIMIPISLSLLSLILGRFLYQNLKRQNDTKLSFWEGVLIIFFPLNFGFIAAHIAGMLSKYFPFFSSYMPLVAFIQGAAYTSLLLYLAHKIKIKEKYYKYAYIIGVPITLLYFFIVGLDFYNETREAEIISNLQKLGGACALYAMDYNSYLPDKGLDQLCTKYGQYQVKPINLLCPSVKHAKEEIAAQARAPILCDYVYNPLEIKKLEAVIPLILIHDKKGNHRNKRYAFFLDGNVKKMSEDEFQKTLANQQANYKNKINFR